MERWGASLIVRSAVMRGLWSGLRIIPRRQMQQVEDGTKIIQDMVSGGEEITWKGVAKRSPSGEKIIQKNVGGIPLGGVGIIRKR